MTVHLPIAVHTERTSIEDHMDRLLQQKEGIARDLLVPIEELDVGAELGARILHEGGSRG